MGVKELVDMKSGCTAHTLRSSNALLAIVLEIVHHDHIRRERNVDPRRKLAAIYQQNLCLAALEALQYLGHRMRRALEFGYSNLGFAHLGL